MRDNSSPIFTDSQTPGRLALLGVLRTRSRLAAIAQTIGVASAREAEFLGDELIRVAARLVSHPEAPRRSSAPRSCPLGAALSTIAEAWPRLTGAQRLAANRLLPAPDSSSHWRRILRERAEASNPAARRAAAETIGDCPLAGTIGLLATLLADPDRSVADASEHALRRLVDGALAFPGGALPEAVADAELDAALAEAARAFPDHRRRGILESAALLLTPARFRGIALPGDDHRPEGRCHGSPLVRWFTDGNDESHLALRSVIRRSSDPRMRARAWEWLAGARGRAESVAAAALDRVATASSIDDHEAVLARAHLLANPTRARRVGLIGTHGSRRSARGMIPDADAMARLSPAARRGLPRVAAAMGARDAAPAGSVIAPPPDPWDPSSETSRLAARRLAQRDPGRFIAGLAARAASGDPDASAGAIQLARRLGLVPGIEPELLGILGKAPGDGGPERVAATAAAALGDVDTDSAYAALRAALAHPVPRVRANAVEAVGRIARRRSGASGDLATADPDAYALLIDLKSDAQHRVRANALRALLAAAAISAPVGEPAAEDELAAMLCDDRAPHRAAALWLAERVLAGSGGSGWRRWNQMAARVAESARIATEPAVRARAQRCARRVLAAARTDWRARAAPVGDEPGGRA